VEVLEDSGQCECISQCKVIINVFCNNIIFVNFVKVCYYNWGKLCINGGTYIFNGI